MNSDYSNPLKSLHEQAGAEMQAYVSVEIVTTFNEPQAEYSAIHKGCGLMDLPQRGIVEVTGADRLKFLNSLLTNELINRETKASLEAGQGVYAFLLNNKSGRIILDLNLLELGDRTLIEIDARLIPLLFETLDRYRFAEKVQWESKVGVLHEIALYGAAALEIAGQLGIAPLATAMSSTSARLLGQEIIAWRDDPCGQPGVHLIIPAAHAPAIWNDILTRFGSFNEIQYARKTVRPIGWAAFNTTRIEAGRPIFGIDFDDTILPLELSLAPRGVSFTKGCYPGQEIVARMHARQAVAKQLMGIRMEDNALPVAGTVIYDAANNQIGGVTSSTVSPIQSKACIALAILKKPHFAIGTTVIIPAEGQMRSAKVVALASLK